MIVTNYDFNNVVDENGAFSPGIQQMLTQLLMYLQNNLSPEGFVVPSLSTANIALLTNAVNGTLVYNTTTNEPMMMINGVFKDILHT